MIRLIQPPELAERMKRGDKLLLLDVRQPWEHEIASLEGSILIPLGELAARAQEIPIPTDATVIVYCHHGVRSVAGAKILEQSGVPDVASLVGGIDAWSEEVDIKVPRY